MKNNKGVTLIEVLVTTVIISIACTGIASFVLIGHQLFFSTTFTANMQNAFNIMHNQLEQEIVTAKRVEYTANTIRITNNDETVTVYEYNKDDHILNRNNQPYKFIGINQDLVSIDNFEIDITETSNSTISLEIETIRTTLEGDLKAGFTASFSARKPILFNNQGRVSKN